MNTNNNEPFHPTCIIGHDYGAAYWIMPVSVRDSDWIQYDDIKEYKQYEISIEEYYFDLLLVDIFKAELDLELCYNKHRYSTDFDPAGRPIEGFAYYLEPNFYTYEDMKRICSKLEEKVVEVTNGRADIVSGKDANSSEKRQKTSEFYMSLADQLKRIMNECTETDMFCVTAP